MEEGNQRAYAVAMIAAHLLSGMITSHYLGGLDEGWDERIVARAIKLLRMAEEATEPEPHPPTQTRSERP